jgi:hypothetical protein
LFSVEHADASKQFGVVSTPTTIASTAIVSSSTTDQTVGMPKSAIDETAIPLGNGKASSTPRIGYLYRCGGVPAGGPPVSTPPWVNTSAGTWNATTKVAAQGSVSWNSTFHAAHVGRNEVLTGNGLPSRSGVFPVATSDPAHAYNPDPGSITAHDIRLVLPYNPTMNKSAHCEAAAVGITVNGIPLLDGFDAGGLDAGAVEVQDSCHGHPNDVVGYHYHSLSPCILSSTARTHTTQVGWALDGYGIYVEYDRSGRLLTNADLDACHGRTSVVPWHGKMVRVYHYDMTVEFPYSVGCFRATPVATTGMTLSGSAGGPGSSQRPSQPQGASGPGPSGAPPSGRSGPPGLGGLPGGPPPPPR